MVALSMSIVRLASMAPSPMPKEIGRLMIKKKTKQKKAIPSVIVWSLSPEWVCPRRPGLPGPTRPSPGTPDRKGLL